MEGSDTVRCRATPPAGLAQTIISTSNSKQPGPSTLPSLARQAQQPCTLSAVQRLCTPGCTGARGALVGALSCRAMKVYRKKKSDSVPMCTGSWCQQLLETVHAAGCWQARAGQLSGTTESTDARVQNVNDCMQLQMHRGALPAAMAAASISSTLKKKREYCTSASSDSLARVLRGMAFAALSAGPRRSQDRSRRAFSLPVPWWQLGRQ